ncbi:hypothetical protein [Flavobacterium sp. UBA7680]|uniref:hypothetical protein n=1 Tax=Flavobacterium sp. UBA7680 TaxID=1946559 RepID=UPI0025C039DE|nr:hypothetical protein [Flavobacterium sp. UBA7680]
MKKNLLFIAGLIILKISAYGQFKSFEIPIQNEKAALVKESNNCESCNAVLDPELQEKTTYYKQSNLRDWLYQYFRSNEEQRSEMKNKAQNDMSLSAVVQSVPIKFGYNSNQSKEYNYWNNKYVEWTNTRLISIDDIAYLFKSDSKDQLKAWLECKRISCSFTSADYAEKSIFLDIEKIRDGKYNITLTNLSLANIKIKGIQVDKVIEKETGKNFRIKQKINNKGGSVSALFSSKSTLDVDFSISVTYKIKGTDDIGTINVIYRVKPKLPDAPIGTIISTTVTYDQFLNINQIRNLSSSEQIWLPCDGRTVPNGNFITKTPDLRGVFLRGANVMDINEGLHTNPVMSNQSNPDNTKVGDFQDDIFKSHTHGYQASATRQVSGRGSVSDFAWDPASYTTSATGGSETRPRNITVIYLIRVR